jgi:hypothetical protein
MNISRLQQHQAQQYNMEQSRLQARRLHDYQKVIEKQNFDHIIAERVARNIRLDLNKGQNIDIEC